ncbi:uncharacterized protein LDX57_009388 [Aspergillus melleus]|uniref:uncharacterized protein n=1 Tax=Aspergillus melleus TaxID=138277 RepID=UPI001E8DC7BB|nr:uncharacterized protein LDX57_009388 [Aspergillus melleus]KAH8431733.1 hypothetical protein LDX57_009388 [Aspergillus melleus]
MSIYRRVGRLMGSLGLGDSAQKHSGEAQKRWEETQRKRLESSDWGYLTATGSWMSRIYGAERSLVEVAQKEALVDEETNTLLKNSAVEPWNYNEESVLNERDRKLGLLNKEYWHAKWNLQNSQATCPYEPLDSAYTCFREKPQWWLLPSLRADCAKRGGCCSRDCGCCERARHAKRPDIVGHCSPSCGCCLRARGFELSPDDAAIFEPRYNLSYNRSVFRSKLMIRYFFGIDG